MTPGPRRFVPVTLGSPRHHGAAVGPFRITHARFPGDLSLAPHRHERACLSITLGGSFDLMLPGLILDCRTGAVVTRPAGERHGNRTGGLGAGVLLIELDEARLDTLGPCAPLFMRIQQLRHAGLVQKARHLAREIRTRDEVAPLAAEGLALEIVATAFRVAESHIAPPPWLRRAQELLHDRFRERLSNDHLAREVGVHPVHLARSFRERYGTTIGNYVRGLRLDWAAERLRRTDLPISDIALQAGFADQSHFTRRFRLHTGLTPGRFRDQR